MRESLISGLSLTAEECERYARHLILPEIGHNGQRRLKGSRVLIVGAGGLGSPAALYLAAAGVGLVGLADADRVDAGNMQRQIVHREAGIGRAKTESARETLAGINSLVNVITHEERLNEDNAQGIIAQYDAVLGCVDNFAARYHINAACVALGKPNMYGSICRFEGQASVFLPDGPCFQCFFQDPPPPDWEPKAEDKGILGTVPGIIGCIQAHETIKVLLGIGHNLAGRLLLFDGLAMRFREVTIQKDPACPVCGQLSHS